MWRHHPCELNFKAYFSLFFSIIFVDIILSISLHLCRKPTWCWSFKNSHNNYFLKMEYNKKESLSFHVIFIIVIPIIYGIYRCFKYLCRSNSFSKLRDSTGKFYDSRSKELFGLQNWQLIVVLYQMTSKLFESLLNIFNFF